MDTMTWIVIVIVVVLIAAVIAVMIGRRRSESQRVEKAAELRTRGQEEDLRSKEQAAEAARQQADAQRARMEADRLEQEAQLRAGEADHAREASRSHLEDATRLDPHPIDADPVVDTEPRRVDDTLNRTDAPVTDGQRAVDPTAVREDRRAG